MTSFLCDYLNEIVILCDGRITTCCFDPLCINSFGNIYQDSLYEIQRKYLEIRNKITHDVLSMPRCSICYNKIKNAGFPNTGTYKVNPDLSEIDFFLNNGENIINRFVIELTILCNLKCNGCMQSREDLKKYRNSYYLDVDHLESWLSPKIKDIKNIRLYNYGETFLHSSAIDFCSFIKNNNQSVSIGIATNGMALDTSEKREELIKSGVDSIVFSIHGSSQEIVQKYMTEKFNFQKILGILQDLVNIKHKLGLSNPKLWWKYLLFTWNDSDDEIKRARYLSAKTGLDGIIFDLVGFPSPSKRFTRDSKDWYQLRNNIL